VPKESSRLGLPGDREHIVKLNADHSSICRFGRSQVDEDNFELVQANIKELYMQGLKAGELRKVQFEDTLEGGTSKYADLTTRFAKVKEKRTLA
jgi:hypothetical protein